ncbi:MAG: hypothetical protein KVP17_000921 [Porospora cf. gigantea B]|uniref:uncharacterized protein n=1 Tax=Porospora cf. gigantea B TaxID=2853592 RepID=UPI003571D017|nr:MAG: hypothetical protein KVP17_000921 [Porospora cf. gigantea B]
MGPTTFLAAFDALFREPLSVRTLSEALTLLDTSNSGKISPQDLRAALTQGGDALSSADAAAVIDMLGLDRPARVRDIANQWVRRQQQTDFSRDQEHEEYPVTH